MALVAAFLVMVLTVLLPVVRDFVRPVLLPLMALCSLLGLALLILSAEWKQRTLPRTFRILAGASTAGFAVGSVLHNALYGLVTVAGDWPILNVPMEVFEVAFFVIAGPLCPVAFLVGTVGAIVLMVPRGGPARG